MASAAQTTSTFKDGAWHGVIEPEGQFPPEKGRYHMYIGILTLVPSELLIMLIYPIGLFCPFAHRVNLIRHLKGLTDIIDISIVKPYPKGDLTGKPGWKFPTADDPYEGATEDHLFGSKYLNEVYFREKKDYEGRYSVPALWDKKTNQMVNNESLELLRNFNTGWNSILPDEYKKIDFYPEHLRKEIDEIGKWMQDDINTGVYKAGFAPDQATYDKNVVPVFKALNRMEELLSKTGGPYILGSELTELDLRLFPTLIRFDPVYVQHFKCNLGTIRHDYPLLNNWMKNLYWNVPAFKETTDFRHIKENVGGHYMSLQSMLLTLIISIQRVIGTSIQRRSLPWAQFQILKAELKRIGVK
jgi:putative glutathione S-transferase